MTSINLASILCVCALVLEGCTGLSSRSNKKVDHALAFDSEGQALSASPLWVRKMPGLISDLSLSTDGNVILVATIPAPGGRKPAQYRLSALNSTGTETWSVPLSSPVRSQDISDDGSLSVISDYDSRLLGVDSAGKILWSNEDSKCRPLILSPLRKIICHHDDDAKPGVAFDVFDWDGKKSLTFRVPKDVLALKRSHDQRRFVVALVEGQVVLFGSDMRSRWQRKVEGEIVDAAVSSTEEKTRVAVLHNVPGKGQQISLLEEKRPGLANVKAQLGSPFHADQIEITPSGDSVYIYGNSAAGQYIAHFPVPASGGGMSLKWQRGDSYQAELSSSMIITADQVIIGIEDISPPARHSHILSFDGDGTLKLNLPVITEDGAYVYAHAYSARSALLAVGTDDSTLSIYKITRE